MPHSLAKRFGSRAVCSAAARSPRESSGCRKSRVSRVGFLAFCRTGRTHGQLRHCGTVTCVCREPPIVLVQIMASSKSAADTVGGYLGCIAVRGAQVDFFSVSSALGLLQVCRRHSPSRNASLADSLPSPPLPCTASVPLSDGRMYPPHRFT